MSRIRPITFGGCLLNNLVSILHQEGRVDGLFREIGFKRTPFTISAASAAQLCDFLTGSIVSPEHVRKFCYLDASHVPTGAQTKIAATADFATVEMSTSVDITYDGFIVNTNRFQQYILPELDTLGIHHRMVAKWRSSLINENEADRAKYAAEILAVLPRQPQYEWIADLVGRTSSRRLTVDEMVEHIARIRDVLRVPLAMVHHNFRFMPDGRPISWPAELKDQSIEVAKRLGAFEHDFAPFVAEHGAKRVLADDFRHWNVDFYPQIANHLYGFFCKVAGRSQDERLAAPPALDLTELETDDVLVEVKPKKKPATREASAPAPTPTPAPAKASAPAPVPVPAPEASPSRAIRNGDVNATGTFVDHIAYDVATGSHFDFDPQVLNMIVVLGQSWALGGNNDEAGDTTVTTTPEHPGHALMFDSGAAPRGRALTRLVDLKENATGSTKETPCGGLADYVMRTCEQRFGRKPVVLFTTVGRGGTTLTGAGQGGDDGLLRGSAQHRETMRLVAKAAEFARAEGKQLRVLALCLAHGESDSGHRMPYEAYLRGMVLVRQHYDADIRRLTGQIETVPMLTYQANRGASRPGLIAGPVLAQFEVRNLDPYIRCIGPVYHHEAEFRADGRSGHLKAIGYRRIGYQFGRYLLDDLFGRGVDPLHIVDVRQSRPDKLEVFFNAPIVVEDGDERVDTSALGPGKGVDFVGTRRLDPTVASVQVSQADDRLLEVVLTEPLRNLDGRLFVAARFTGPSNCGRRQGARSGIRSKVAYGADPLGGEDLFDWACTQVVALKRNT